MVAISKACRFCCHFCYLERGNSDAQESEVGSKKSEVYEKIVRVDIRKSFIFRGIEGVRGAMRFHDAI